MTDEKLPGRVRTMKVFTRRVLAEHRGKAYFMFGDNLFREGFGGQAAACRDAPNAIGVPTKRRPARTADAFFEDADIENPNGAVRRAIDEAFRNAMRVLRDGYDLYLPADGLGTGRAELATRAPKVLAYIEDKVRVLRALYGESVEDPAVTKRRAA